MLIATVKNSQAIALYDASTMQYRGTIQVTCGGHIVGTPTVTPDLISVTVKEGNRTYLVNYDHRMQTKGRIDL